MCQLLGMNCNTPTDIQFSFEGFAKRGGLTDEHKDGWGIAFFEGHAARCFIDHEPASSSPVAELVRTYPIRSYQVICHIRKATLGDIKLANCHPFVRELWGQAWVFAHNGDLKNYHPDLKEGYQPIGETDSEQAFCQLLTTLKTKFKQCHKTKLPPITEVSECLAEESKKIADHGTFNLLMSNGQALFTHCSTNLFYIIRKHPFTKAKLLDADLEVDFGDVTTPKDVVALIATTPLTTDETWTQYQKGEFLTFIDGIPIQKR